ncbi:MAG: polysaccharide deacetylase family protein [Candidatus Koribacter versatilis]|nr:polysaccharide deacetylase family protein [Candidatus Koribacter versatilis]
MARRYTRNILWLLALLCAGCSLLAQTPPKTAQERMGYPASARLLVIHADDLGMNHSVNRATFEALEKGWITSASILVPCPWFPEVARWAIEHPDADLGIHQALNSEWTDFRWGPISGAGKVPSLVDERGYLPLETPAVAQNAKMPDVEYELRAQIDRAQKAGIRVTHLDTHMAALMSTPELFGVYQKMGDEFHVPILFERTGTHSPQVIAVPADILVERVITMEPGVAAKDWLDWYKKQLTPLPSGVYQLIVHLAYDNEEMQGATWDHSDWGAAWRQRDLDMVKSPEFKQFLKEQGFVLVTWRKLAEALPQQAVTTIH